MSGSSCASSGLADRTGGAERSGRAKPFLPSALTALSGMRGERQLVRLSRELLIDLGRDVERPVERAPARHPVPGPPRLVLRNGRGLPELDAAEVEIVGSQGLDVRVTGGPAFLEVGHVPPLVGRD